MIELEVSVGHDLTFAHFLLRCGGVLPNGRRVEDRARATLCLRKEVGRWRVHHQHVSMPLPAGGDSPA